jgi:hypothetical protein
MTNQSNDKSSGNNRYRVIIPDYSVEQFRKVIEITNPDELEASRKEVEKIEANLANIQLADGHTMVEVVFANYWQRLEADLKRMGNMKSQTEITEAERKQMAKIIDKAFPELKNLKEEVRTPSEILEEKKRRKKNMSTASTSALLETISDQFQHLQAVTLYILLQMISRTEFEMVEFTLEPVKPKAK